MGRLIYTELLKLKRCKMFIISILGSLMSPLLNFFILINRRQQNPDITIDFVHYFKQTNLLISAFIGVLLFALVATYIFNREYEEDTLKSILTIPVSRTSLIVSKLVVLLVWILLLMVLALVFCLILGSIGGIEGLTIQVVIEYLLAYLLTGVFLFFLSIAVVFITLIFKGYVPSLAFAIMATVTSLVVMNSKYIGIFPWTAQLQILGYNDQIIHPIYMSWISILSVFIISLLGSIIYFKKVDID